MRAVVYHGQEDFRVDRVEDPSILEPTDAMADAIDRSYAVCYGVSLECERPIHPAAFLLVWLR